MLRNEIGKELITLLVDQCLMGSIPETKDQLQSYNSVCISCINLCLYFCLPKSYVYIIIILELVLKVYRSSN